MATKAAAVEEPKDIKKDLEKSCHHHCPDQWKEYLRCAKRIEGDKTGKHCTPYYFNYLHCIDHCVAPKLFKTLK